MKKNKNKILISFLLILATILTMNLPGLLGGAYADTDMQDGQKQEQAGTDKQESEKATSESRQNQSEARVAAPDKGASADGSDNGEVAEGSAAQSEEVAEMPAMSLIRTMYSPGVTSSYNIKYNLNGGSFPAGASICTNAQYTSEFTVPYPAKDGCEFYHWEITGMDSSDHKIGNETIARTTWRSDETVFSQLNATNGATVTFKALYNHTCDHVFNITGQGNVLSATCTIPDCIIEHTYSSPTLTLQLSVEDNIHAGEEPFAQYAGGKTWGRYVSRLPDIHYVGRNDTILEDTTEVPTRGGYYTASITVGDATATYDFTIICDHDHKTHHDQVNASDDQDGTKEYWSCDTCPKIFDADGNEIKDKSSLVIPATGQADKDKNDNDKNKDNKADKGKKDESPKTGDDSNIMGVLLLMLLAGSGITAMIIRRKRTDK